MGFTSVRRREAGWTSAGPFGDATWGVPQDRQGRGATRNGWIDIRDLGARGNGSSSATPVGGTGLSEPALNSAALQTAMDLASGFGGGTVYIPPGIYVLASQNFLRTNVTLRGAGMSRSVLKAGPTQERSKPFIRTTPGAAVHNILCEGITFDANVTARTGTVNAGVYNGGQGKGLSGAVASTNVVYSHCECKNMDLGLVFQNVSDAAVLHCYVHHNERDAINMSTVHSDCRIIGNRVHTVGDDFIAVSTADDMRNITLPYTRTTIADNVLGGLGSNAGGGITVNGVTDTTVTGNVILDPFGSGIACGDEGGIDAPIHRLVIANNVIRDPGKTSNIQGACGIEITLARPNYNQLEPPEKPASEVPANAIPPGYGRAIVIANNVITNPRKHGIGVIQSSNVTSLQDIIISNNQLTGPGGIAGSQTIGRGISFHEFGFSPGYVDGTTTALANSMTIRRASILGNDIRNWNNRGISIQGGSAVGFLIAGNNITDNGRTHATEKQGIWVNNASNVSIINNQVRSPAGTHTHGVALTALTGNNLIAGNDLTGNPSGAISRSSLSAGTWIEENGGDAIPSIASAATIHVTAAVCAITGTSTISTIQAGHLGQRVTLRFDAGAAVDETGNVVLAGRFPAAGGATLNSMLSLVCDGVGWKETSRSIN